MVLLREASPHDAATLFTESPNVSRSPRAHSLAPAASPAAFSSASSFSLSARVYSFSSTNTNAANAAPRYSRCPASAVP